MQLIHKKNTQAILSVVEQDIVLAQQSAICRDISDEELVEELVKIYGELYLLIRWETPKARELVLMADQLMKDFIRKYFQTLTINEIRLVGKNGIAKFYGEFTTISPATVGGWLNKFMASPERDIAKKHLKRLNMKEEKVLTENEKEKIVHDGALLAFEDFKNGKKLVDAGNATYNYLNRIGVIPFTKKRKDTLYMLAKAEMIEAKKLSRTSVKDISIIREINNSIKDLESGFKQDEVIIEAKRKVLNVFFAELVETGTELIDLINYVSPK